MHFKDSDWELEIQDCDFYTSFKDYFILFYNIQIILHVFG